MRVALPFLMLSFGLMSVNAFEGWGDGWPRESTATPEGPFAPLMQFWSAAPSTVQPIELPKKLAQ